MASRSVQVLPPAPSHFTMVYQTRSVTRKQAAEAALKKRVSFKVPVEVPDKETDLETPTAWKKVVSILLTVAAVAAALSQ